MSNFWNITEDNNLIGALYYLSWTLFVRNSDTENDYPRVATYVNTRFSKLWFFMWKDVFNYRDINLISFFNHSTMHFFLNVYSDSQQSALKHLKDTEINLNNVIIMTGDFNIHNSDWDLSYPHYSIYADTLHKISDSLSLELFTLSTLSPHCMQTMLRIQTQSLISCSFNLTVKALIITKSCQTYKDHQTMLL